MHTQLLMHEAANAIHREREMTGAARTGTVKRSDRSIMGGLAAGAQYYVGSALVRAGRSLQRDTAPRPEAVVAV
jgi:hypothetical protein